MGKRKREDDDAEEDETKEKEDVDQKSNVAVVPVPTYEELVQLVGPIAKPLASKKLCKRLMKVVKKAQKVKRLRRGVKEVVKALRKNQKGIVVLAGDVSPIDVISHIPVFCEDKQVPYCYVPSRRELGTAGGTKRPTSVILVESGKDYEDLYKQCHTDVDALPLPL